MLERSLAAGEQASPPSFPPSLALLLCFVPPPPLLFFFLLSSSSSSFFFFYSPLSSSLCVVGRGERSCAARASSFVTVGLAAWWSAAWRPESRQVHAPPPLPSLFCSAFVASLFLLILLLSFLSILLLRGRGGVTERDRVRRVQARSWCGGRNPAPRPSHSCAADASGSMAAGRRAMHTSASAGGGRRSLTVPRQPITEQHLAP